MILGRFAKESLSLDNHTIIHTMCPSFIALFSKAGIACAADADHTIYSLSKDYPVAIAVNPASPIPWEQIIEEYRRRPFQEHSAFSDYGKDFEAYLETVPVQPGLTSLSAEESNIILMGFGSEDLFPAALDVMVSVQDGKLCFCDLKADGITHRNIVFFYLLGNHESIATLLWGSTAQVRQYLYDEQLKRFETASRRVSEKFKGTKYESYVKKHLDAFDYQAYASSILDRSTDKTLDELKMGIGSFSIEDMVTAVESLTKANAKLNYLRSGAKGPSAEVREIAVMTIPEGLTWIKHSLFYRRNEL